MPVILTADKAVFMNCDRRLAVDSDLAADTTIDGIAEKLESAFDASYGIWRLTALSLQQQRTSEWAHMPTLSTYASDFGTKLAWLQVVESLIRDEEKTAVLCPDPWLYRALALLPGIEAGPPPRIAAKRLRFFCRGILARSRAAARCIIARYRTRKHRSDYPVQASWLLVYGHPESNAQGRDAYFGSLMADIPALQRLMHTDCGADFALKLATDGRTRSLHAWGSILAALSMPFRRWRPDTSGLDTKIAWLVQRAAAIEGSGGSAAMTHWQMHCHATWLAEANPKVVSWPWENHPWERDFVRAASSLGVKTLGYQHTVVGRHMFNQGADANLDGLDSIPRQIALNGPAFKDDLKVRGIPEDIITIAGSFRVGGSKLPDYAPDGPVFVALSNNPVFAGQMINALRPLAAADRPMLIKDHPLSPFPVTESPYFSHTRLPLSELPALRALVYCTGTSGLEGILAGIPTLRFIPEGGIALDILPAGMQVDASSAAALAGCLQRLSKPPRQNAGTLFPPPETDTWKTLLDLT